MIAFSYESETFSEELFAAHGKMVAVVLNYDKKGKIQEAVKSAFSQDWPCYEILVMDDASRDGSEQDMLECTKRCVAECSGKPLKVTVVLNKENVTTLGQWRQAVNLSCGEWFGMFCGDDISDSGRIRIGAELSKTNPGAVAVCTNFTKGRRSAEMFYSPFYAVHEARAVSEWRHIGTVYGCSAFWRRNLLLSSLPDGVMDDFILTWIAAIKNAGSLVWDCTRSTVCYTIGSGITTVDRIDRDDGVPSVKNIFRKYRSIRRHGQKFGCKVWGTIKTYDDKYGTDEEFSRIVRGYWVASLSEGGWFGRMKAMWLMLVVDHGNDYGGERRFLLKKVFNRFLLMFLGPFSFIPLFYLRTRLFDSYER